MKKNEVDLCSIYGKFFTTYPGKGGAWLCSDFDEQHAFSNFLFSPFLASIHIRIAASQTGRKAHSFYIRPQTLSVVLHFERKTKFLSTDVLFTELYLPLPYPCRVYLSTIVRQCEVTLIREWSLDLNFIHRRLWILRERKILICCDTCLRTIVRWCDCS